MKKVLSIFAATTLTAGLVTIEAPANAAPSCVAQLNLSGGRPANPPGQYGDPVKGAVVRIVAHLDRTYCFDE